MTLKVGIAQFSPALGDLNRNLKTIHEYIDRANDEDWELYDMDADRSELHNLAARHPDRVKEMADKWETFARKAHMLPWPWKGTYAAKKGKTG